MNFASLLAGSLSAESDFFYECHAITRIKSVKMAEDTSANGPRQQAQSDIVRR